MLKLKRFWALWTNKGLRNQIGRVQKPDKFGFRTLASQVYRTKLDLVFLEVKVTNFFFVHDNQDIRFKCQNVNYFFQA